MKSSDGSKYDKLFYPFLFEGGRADDATILEQVRQSTIRKSQEIVALRRAALDRNAKTLVAAGTAMAQAFAEGATLFAFGNGGSTTDAQDIVIDLLSPVYREWRSLPAIALTSDVAIITAVGNDVGFDNIFSRQIIAMGKEGDIALGISTSGNSRNIVAAFKQAKKQSLLTVGIAGYDGGDMARSSAVDFCLVTPGDHIPRLQEAQATVYHTLLHVIQACLAAGS